jgi:hypothetical protein
VLDTDVEAESLDRCMPLPSCSLFRVKHVQLQVKCVLESCNTGAKVQSSSSLLRLVHLLTYMNICSEGSECGDASRSQRSAPFKRKGDTTGLRKVVPPFVAAWKVSSSSFFSGVCIPGLASLDAPPHHVDLLVDLFVGGLVLKPE